jgi:hypothetical protein
MKESERWGDPSAITGVRAAVVTVGAVFMVPVLVVVAVAFVVEGNTAGRLVGVGLLVCAILYIRAILRGPIRRLGAGGDRDSAN